MSIPISELLAKPCTAFEGSQLLSSGPLVEVVLAVKTAVERGAPEQLLTFDDATGRVIDLDLRGTKADVIKGLSQSLLADSNTSSSRHTAAPAASGESAAGPRGRGRPKLGVIGREVTLLPRHWEWLTEQPGGPSVALRKLVEVARLSKGAVQKTRAAQEACYHFMSAMAGDLPGFEEATRALFANDRVKFVEQVSGWPNDLRAYAEQLAFGKSVEGFAP